MAFNVHFQLVENPIQMTSGTPWLCDKCHKEDRALLKINADYDTLVLCKKCLLDAKKIITEREKELKDERKNTRND